MAKHYMMLSDLYGRIGQMLQEHGDAPIGKYKSMLFPNEPHLPIDYINPAYCTVTYVTTNVNNMTIKNYELIINK